MARNISIDQLSNAITRELKNYSKEVEKEIEKVRNQVSKDAVEELKENSPKDQGDYAKSWTRKKTPNGWIVHNKLYQLTHLLEKGHAKRGGGRVPERVHIAPVEEKAITQLIEGIERAVQE